MHNLTGDRLRTIIGREELDYTQLMAVLAPYKQPRSKITKWLADGTLIRVKKGLYVFGPRVAREPYFSETLANLIYGPSAISLEYALAYYGLIPERVLQLTSITSKKNKKFETPIGVFSYQHLHPEKYPCGITQVYLNDSHPVLMATPEKALADYLNFRCHDSDFNRIDDMLTFLRDDLRLDNDSLLHFNSELLDELQGLYKRKALQWIIKIVKGKIRYE